MSYFAHDQALVHEGARIGDGTRIWAFANIQQGAVIGRGCNICDGSFVEKGAVQCGYCTPGMIMTAKALLDQNPHPSETQVKQAIGGNLCRCTGYVKIVEAVMAAASSADDGRA